MLCTFCGTDNRPENKFCGMCGVRLERRKVERRVQQSSANTKCPSCDHVNEQGLKFCAMCGARVDRRVSERRTAADEVPRAGAIANAQIPGPEGPPVATAEAISFPEPKEVVETPPPLARPAPTAFHSDPGRPPAAITGPSFLGLSDDPRDRADYLLEEEEGSSGGVLRKLVMVAVLAAIGGLVFMQWRAGFPLLQRLPGLAGPPKTETVRSPQAPPPSSAPAASQETNAANAVPDLGKDVSVSPAEAAPGKAKPADTAPLEKADQPALSDVSSPKTETPPADNPSRVKPKAAKDDEEKPSPMLLRAQAYLQGTGGVPQNCDQGLVYLRAAAKTEAAAAVQMGALYATGHCVEQDRVAAYRWLNSAHELQPDNPRIQLGLNQLWTQMTQQERSQIVR